ncbi:pYEATS domain-containing protein [Dokdonia sp.]|uniref:pYEATS domain-containing protein n=1 Tax=Dokdonia sp. TaxID=2024995 RepID=UPI003265736B
MTVEQVIELIKILIWPIIALVVYLTNIRRFKSIFNSLESRIKSGSELEFQGFKVGVALSLPEAKQNEDITDEHLALIHSSWRYQRKDKEFGKRMFGIQVIVQGQISALDRIEYVKYKLDASYPNPVQKKYDRTRNFELKELAWGTSTIRAEVKIKDQEKLIKLSRFINLSETGEKLID